jgi:hypothetical protein
MPLADELHSILRSRLPTSVARSGRPTKCELVLMQFVHLHSKSEFPVRCLHSGNAKKEGPG